MLQDGISTASHINTIVFDSWEECEEKNFLFPLLLLLVLITRHLENSRFLVPFEMITYLAFVCHLTKISKKSSVKEYS